MGGHSLVLPSTTPDDLWVVPARLTNRDAPPQRILPADHTSWRLTYFGRRSRGLRGSAWGGRETGEKMGNNTVGDNSSNNVVGTKIVLNSDVHSEGARVLSGNRVKAEVGGSLIGKLKAAVTRTSKRG